MRDEDLLRRARAAGIDAEWTSFDGRHHQVGETALRAVLAPLEAAAAPRGGLPEMITADIGAPITLSAPAGTYRLHFEDGAAEDGHAAESTPGHVTLPPIHRPGYHRLEIAGGEVTLAVAPARCWTIGDAFAGRRGWGLAVQLYSLRHTNDGGMGDFTALRSMVANAGAIGCDAIAISPVHALFAADANHISPYSPSSRIMWNGLYADPGASAWATRGGLPAEFLDWRHASAVRLAAFRQNHATLLAGLGPDLTAFEAFRTTHGAALQRHAVFEALHGHRLAADPTDWDWHGWPAELRDPDHAAVAAFASENANEVSFHAYLQFMADTALAGAQQAARDAGMRIGLISDIAVGVSPGGSDAWGRQGEMLEGLSIGAPPDLLNTAGQDWGVTTYSPDGLAQHGYRTLLQMLRSALRHAGGVRLDHVMGLARLWVVPRGHSAADGAYLRFPIDDILRLVRLESARHKAIILGEDLGTLPEGFPERLKSNGLAGMKVLWFERAGQGFTSPAHWPRADVAMTSTHDLPTMAGWWAGRDVDWRERLGVGDPPAEHAAREHERRALWSACQISQSRGDAAPDRTDANAIADAVCTHIGTANCDLVLLPIEDALAMQEQPNLPNTVDEHPNWRRRLPSDVDSMLADPTVAARLEAMAGTRP